MKTTTKEVREKIERYIIDCIDTSPYDDIQRSEMDRLKFVWECFNNEYASHQIKYYNGNVQSCFIGWVQGLPSVFNIDFENHAILEKGREWGMLPPLPSEQYRHSPALKKAVENKEDQFLKNWWGAVYVRFKSMLDSWPRKQPYQRKTKDVLVKKRIKK